jgi:hypothetical protein
MPLNDDQLRGILEEVRSRITAVEAELHRRGGPRFEDSEAAAHRLLEDLDRLAGGIGDALEGP